MTLSDQSALSVTIAEFRSPVGHYMGGGLTPTLSLSSCGADATLSSASSTGTAAGRAVERIKWNQIRYDKHTQTWSLI